MTTDGRYRSLWIAFAAAAALLWVAARDPILRDEIRSVLAWLCCEGAG